jgi:hypothetical protein
MARRTAKTAQEAVDWINNTPHHRGRWEPLMGVPQDGKVFFVLGGRAGELRIPIKIHEQIEYQSNPWAHERMYNAALK